jgi:hypothetical protein
MCEAQRFLLQQSNVPVHTSLQQWLLNERTGWVCVSDVQALEVALSDKQHAADAYGNW